MVIHYKTAALIAGAALATSVATASQAQNLMISAGLPQSHNWVGHHMDPFMAAVEEASGGSISFTPFYAGELVGIGRELDALTSGTIDIAAPLLSPYHEGRFPLSDVSQLPTYNTDSEMVTRAYLNLMNSDVDLGTGATFYEYEVSSKGIVAWPLGATPPYFISTTGRALDSAAAFRGMPLRAGSAIHTIVLEELGATAVTMPATGAYEALSRGTLEGIVLAVSDWPTYSLDRVLSFTLTDAAIGHWQSYLAISEATWNSLDAENREQIAEAALATTMANAAELNRQLVENRASAEAEHGAQFVSVDDMPQELQDHVAAALTRTWVRWVEMVEGAGHPGRATARLYAELILAEGGELPEGVAEYLEM